MGPLFFVLVFYLFQCNGDVVFFLVVAALKRFDRILFVKPAKQVNLATANGAEWKCIGFRFQKFLFANGTDELLIIGLRSHCYSKLNNCFRSREFHGLGKPFGKVWQFCKVNCLDAAGGLIQFRQGVQSVRV